jgi:hypothetical protein
VSGRDLKQLLNGFWLFATKLVDQGVTHSVVPEGQNDIGVYHTWECVALLGEMSNVVPKGLTLLLPAAPEVPRVAEAHIGALEVAGKDLPQVIPMVYGVSQEMVQPGFGGFYQIDWEELDDEQIIICHSRSTREVVILQPNTGVNFAIIFGYVAWRPETSRKMSVAHGTPECLGTRPFGAKAVSLMIVVPPLTWVPRT